MKLNEFVQKLYNLKLGSGGPTNHSGLLHFDRHGRNQYYDRERGCSYARLLSTLVATSASIHLAPRRTATQALACPAKPTPDAKAERTRGWCNFAEPLPDCFARL